MCACEPGGCCACVCICLHQRPPAFPGEEGSGLPVLVANGVLYVGAAEGKALSVSIQVTDLISALIVGLWDMCSAVHLQTGQQHTWEWVLDPQALGGAPVAEQESHNAGNGRGGCTILIHLHHGYCNDWLLWCAFRAPKFCRFRYWFYYGSSLHSPSLNPL